MLLGKNRWLRRLSRGTARRALGCLLAAALLLAQGMAFPAARAETADGAVIAPVTSEGVNARIAYPQISGLADAGAQSRINDAIVEKANIGAHLRTLMRMTEDGWGLTVRYETFLRDGVLSVLVDAKGQMPNGRDGQQYTALVFDTATGRQLTPEDLFRDPDAALALLEEKVQQAFTDDYTGYLDSAELLPFPMTQFFVDDTGVTFYYPASQFALFSGYGGACHFCWYELSDALDYGGELLTKLGVQPPAPPASDVRERIARACAAGTLPGVPLKLGDDMTDAVARYRLLHDPDYYPGGKYYQMEAPPFRNVLVLSDALTSGYEGSVVMGLQARRIDFFGLRTGETTRAACQAALGAPDASVTLSDADAADFGLPGGVTDYYAFGAATLRLHADGDGVLYCVQLMR